MRREDGDRASGPSVGTERLIERLTERLIERLTERLTEPQPE